MFVFCLAGLGSRFTKAGINRPKYLLPTKTGVPILSLIINQIRLPSDEQVILVLNSRHKDYYNDLASVIKNYGYRVCYIKDSSGQAETAKIAAELTISEFPKFSGKPILFHNGDTILLNRNITEYITTLTRADGIIDTFHNADAKYSYVSFSEDKVTFIKEKSVISDHATTGLYGFKSPEYYLSSYAETQFNGEQYISSIYEFLLSRNAYIIDKHANDPDDTIVLGTPEQYQTYLDA